MTLMLLPPWPGWGVASLPQPAYARGASANRRHAPSVRCRKVQTTSALNKFRCLAGVFERRSTSPSTQKRPGVVSVSGSEG